MSMRKEPMTPEGHQKLKDELENLLKVQRPENVRAIAEARAHGDLSENAEYHAAKERQSFIEGRIQEVQNKIARADVIDPAKINHDKVAFGATVTVLDVDTNEEKIFKIVGVDESDIKTGKLSIHSPMAKSLIGKAEGDEVTVRAPARTIEYEILEIRFE
jgi:transcription elongation factor GreA